MFSALNEPLLASSPSSTGTGADALEAPPEYTGHWGALCGFFGVKMPYLNEHLTQDYKKVLDTCKSFAKSEKNAAAREICEKTGYVLEGEQYHFLHAERAPGRKPEEVFTVFPLDHLVTRPTLQKGERDLERLAEQRGDKALQDAAEALRRINRAAGIPEPGYMDNYQPKRYVVEEPGGDFNEHVKRFKRKVYDMSQKTRWPNRLWSESYFNGFRPDPPPPPPGLGDYAPRGNKYDCEREYRFYVFRSGERRNLAHFGDFCDDMLLRLASGQDAKEALLQFTNHRRVELNESEIKDAWIPEARQLFMYLKDAWEQLGIGVEQGEKWRGKAAECAKERSSPPSFVSRAAAGGSDTALHRG